jgi:hypothetical protein
LPIWTNSAVPGPDELQEALTLQHGAVGGVTGVTEPTDQRFVPGLR